MRGMRIVEHDDSKGCKTTLQFVTPLEKSLQEAETEVLCSQSPLTPKLIAPRQVVLEKHFSVSDTNAAFKRFLSNVFLPVGYPHSVSPGMNSHCSRWACLCTRR